MMSDMSDDLSVKLYFGNGQIRYGEHGVDLSEFNSVDHVLKKQTQEVLGPLSSFFKGISCRCRAT
jgi:hypothetical protein